MILLRCRCWVFIGVLCFSVGSQAADKPSEAFFEEHIRPVLVQHCIQCHGEKKQESGLRLDSLSGILAGGDNGPAVVPKDPDESLLLSALRYDSLEMPPNEPLDDAVIRQFEHWIREGAAWPEHTSLRRDPSGQITDEDRSWWAFQPLARHEPPDVHAQEWVRTPIDRFVLWTMEDNNLKPSPPADKATLMRRLYHDLVGMPPTPAEVDDFVHDEDPLSWEKQVDRLLSDSRYGEHWARFWLDVVRYSESDGWKQDAYRPDIWRYRDYVVRALNDDKPWADFVCEQIAGDEIASDRTGEDRLEALAAAGYLRLSIFEYNQRNARAHWNDIQNDVTDVTSDVFLGMSLACCRCHDHKYDALPQTDYFRLKAFFEPVVWRDDVPAATDEKISEYRTQLAEWEDATQSIREEIDALTQPYIDRKRKATVEKFPLDIQACFHKAPHERNSWEQQMAYLVDRQFYEEGGGPLVLMNKADKQLHEELQKRLAEFDNIRPEPLPNLMTVNSFTGPTAPTTVSGSGDGIPVTPGVPGVLADASSPISQWTPTAGRERPQRRIELADWITSPDNPLTTRVFVNRIWQQHFGRGLVNTPNDFGRLGSLPSHPELLDWLAVSFIENGGSLKQLHRRILLSAVWKQSAYHPAAEQCRAIDPEERLLWRAPVRRLTAEQIRDSMLFVSGELDDAVGGPSVDFDVPRRSIYVKQFRNATESFLRLFDSANGMRSVAVRDTTTTPMQSLLLLNGTWSLERAKTLAGRLQSAAPVPPDQLVREAIHCVHGRVPTADEQSTALGYLLAGESPDGAGSQERLVDLCHVLLNSNEFLYVD